MKTNVIILSCILIMSGTVFAEDVKEKVADPVSNQTQTSVHVMADTYVADPNDPRWDPVTDVKEIQSRLEEFLDRNFGGRTRRVLGRPGQEGPMFNPPTDMAETEKEVIVTVDMPGVSKSDISVEVRDKTLILSGTRKDETSSVKNEVGTEYRMQERRVGSFQRQIPLPDNIDEGKIKAEYRDGILTVRLPKLKQEKSEPLKVPVQ